MLSIAAKVLRVDSLLVVNLMLNLEFIVYLGENLGSSVSGGGGGEGKEGGWNKIRHWVHECQWTLIMPRNYHDHIFTKIYQSIYRLPIVKHLKDRIR